MNTDAVADASKEVSERDRRAAWQRELSSAFRSVSELLAALELTSDDLRAGGVLMDEQAAFPVLVPQSFLNRMRLGDPADPLLLQVLPQSRENQQEAGFVKDAVQDLQARRAPGVLQKYEGRVLLLAGGSCAVHCRYCFRREYPYASEPRTLADWEPALTQIASDNSVTEVILSGGDPWMLNDRRLTDLCSRLDAIPHLERIRFHTRLPIVLPSRVTAALMDMLRSLRTQPIVVVHANHASEIAADCSEALASMVRKGVPVLNQSVLLRGVNDSVAALEDLSRALIRIGVMPYYLHQLDRVRGTSHFEVPVPCGRELIRELQRRLPGYAVPRFVQEIPGEPHKTPL